MQCQVHDLLLIHIDGKPAVYARIEAMEPDVKPGWLRVRLLVLTVPLQVVTWILQPEQIDGLPFTMGGMPMRLERILPPAIEPPGGGPPPESIAPERGGKVISLRQRKKGP